MLAVDYSSRRLTRSTCAALGHGKHRCLLNNASPDSHPLLIHRQSPVARLSNDELLLIFEAARDSVFAKASAFEQLQHPDILVTISHVCHLWRAIALSNSGLWTNVFTCSHSMVEQHLSRSGTRPLRIYGRFPAQQGNIGHASGEDESTAIAAALIAKAYRWKTLAWIDHSANGATNVVHLLHSPNAYPALERLELGIPQCIPLEAGADNASNTSLFPALQHLSLTRVHPVALPRSTMPSLLTLELNCLAHRMLFSQLIPLLCGTPALRTLTIHHTFPTLDPHHFANIGLTPPNWLPDGTLSVAGAFTVKLPMLDSLSLSPTPTWTLWILLYYLELPSLTKLDLHIHSDWSCSHWPWLPHNGRLRLEAPMPRPSDPYILSRTDWAMPLPTLRTLHITYYISPPKAPAPGSDVPPPATLQQLRRLLFLGLTELKIFHAFATDPATKADSPATLPLPPLPAFDVLFHAPDFRCLVRLSLIGSALPLATLCDALRTRMPALESLALVACQGAGALVCALAPGECGGGCERWPGNDSEDVWVGMKVRMVLVRQCADVRAGCLRKVIAGRVRASAGSRLERISSESGGGRDSATKVERPRRITQIQIVGCAGVTKDDVAALATIPGAPSLYWLPTRLAQ